MILADRRFEMEDITEDRVDYWTKRRFFRKLPTTFSSALQRGEKLSRVRRSSLPRGGRHVSSRRTQFSVSIMDMFEYGSSRGVCRATQLTLRAEL